MTWVRTLYVVSPVMKHSSAAASRYQAPGCLGLYRRTPEIVATTDERPIAVQRGDRYAGKRKYRQVRVPPKSR